MRFMMIVKGNKKTEAGGLPSKEHVAEMARFNEEMVNAGVMLAGEGLHPSSKGVRVRISKGKRTVTQGPFARPKDLIAGYWVIKAKSMEEAIEWAKRCPEPLGPGVDAEIELRQIFEPSDLPAEILPPEEAAREQALRARMESEVPSP